jgi:hypothetical protein
MMGDVLTAAAAPAETSEPADPVLTEVRRTFPRWVAWQSAAGWHARRAGDFVEPRAGRKKAEGLVEVYYVFNRNPALFVLLLDSADRSWPRDPREPAPVPHPPAAGLRLALAAQPIDLARDVIAARIEAAYPDWIVDHHPYGWTATHVDDPERKLNATSSGELESRLMSDRAANRAGD